MKTSDNLAATLNGKTIEGVVPLDYQIKGVDRMNNVAKKLGKISSVKLGIGGYQDMMLGLYITFSFGSYDMVYSKQVWDSSRVKHVEGCKWTEEERDNEYAGIMRYISCLLKEAKVDSIDKLKGKPVELTIKDFELADWRILTEVL